MAVLPPSNEVETTSSVPAVIENNTSRSDNDTTSVNTTLTPAKKRSRNRRRRRAAGQQQQQQQRARSNSSGNLSDGDCSSASSSSSSSDDSTSRKAKQPKAKKNKTKKQQQSAAAAVPWEERQHYLAMDCEMVGVGMYGTKSALARVTIVDWDGNTVYDEFVQPQQPVSDYRTFVSGITEADLTDALDLETCRQQVLKLLEDKILVGHALKNDLHALDIQHPWQRTRDTAKYEPFMQVRFDDGVLWPRKLQHLAADKLQKQIQLPGQPHSAHEDAVTALQLYQKVRPKWEKVMQYKISKTAEILEQQQQQQQKKQ